MNLLFFYLNFFSIFYQLKGVTLGSAKFVCEFFLFLCKIENRDIDDENNR